MTAATLLDQPGAGIRGPKVQFGGRVLNITAQLAEDGKVAIEEELFWLFLHPGTEGGQVQGKPTEPLLMQGR